MAILASDSGLDSANLECGNPEPFRKLLKYSLLAVVKACEKAGSVLAGFHSALPVPHPAGSFAVQHGFPAML
ncbi:hypothetical protein [Aurantivibrio plasticivorans]